MRIGNLAGVGRQAAAVAGIRRCRVENRRLLKQRDVGTLRIVGDGRVESERQIATRVDKLRDQRNEFVVKRRGPAGLGRMSHHRIGVDAVAIAGNEPTVEIRNGVDGSVQKGGALLLFDQPLIHRGAQIVLGFVLRERVRLFLRLQHALRRRSLDGRFQNDDFRRGESRRSGQSQSEE